MTLEQEFEATIRIARAQKTKDRPKEARERRKLAKLTTSRDYRPPQPRTKVPPAPTTTKIVLAPAGPTRAALNRAGKTVGVFPQDRRVCQSCGVAQETFRFQHTRKGIGTRCMACIAKTAAQTRRTRTPKPKQTQTRRPAPQELTEAIRRYNQRAATR